MHVIGIARLPDPEKHQSRRLHRDVRNSSGAVRMRPTRRWKSLPGPVELPAGQVGYPFVGELTIQGPSVKRIHPAHPAAHQPPLRHPAAPTTTLSHSGGIPMNHQPSPSSPSSLQPRSRQLKRIYGCALNQFMGQRHPCRDRAADIDLVSRIPEVLVPRTRRRAAAPSSRRLTTASSNTSCLSPVRGRFVTDS